ncbi:MAG: signal peptide peptidase SppA [Planctomycetota bacterium]
MRLIRPSALLALAVAMLPPLTGCAPQAFVINLAPVDNRYQEEVVIEAESSTRNKVALIDVSGLIVNADQPGLLQDGPNPVSAFAEQLAQAEEDDRVKAVLLRINSPGGSVTATEAMFTEAQRFKQQTGKPVVVQMMTTAASGGFYLACVGDEVWAYPSTITGSIGVVLQLVSIKPALDRWGVEATTVASGANKAAGSPLTTLDDAQRAVFQSMVDEFYAGFVDVVAARRPGIDPSKLSGLTDGRILTGKQAQDAGLIDALGTLRESSARAIELANIDDANVVRYRRPLQYVGSPYASSPVSEQGPSDVEINLVQLRLSGSAFPSAGFYYVWAPGQ